ncbi:MAG: hypothetical protein A3A98_03295 [Candidatus Staskawiczbacteria bacterium RIFCSPLOWO2_01_FULL_40_39]|uniref:Calcineurin-like phosphoesterase domain-containing protein n=1 Tax=Candidatus Staskawiczbacteria bacterium RIFCSPHIGHO2_01_FULL_39_25 TaxID=1802202 RepID=A0A1G2HQ45_9BACT|nr:MAG: hypothetical protein A2730_02570 [Candidatus Staskawiczbacteria bacterium RIFCSPHIGHO2_01_FULL_39_25]OGZ72840.1 MAG: hypothetical protein A3A98_03295 [Candidatus Staskawiczbacteria bacterium RIFCSPLOWO2_01_FULL_40_39]OGZ75949.1 MAG: hypothetical protein A3I87_00360 [Candidatus Staskawiczbacteria bacterium RIFCSPLOWO2_02_FULL_39_8]
MNETDILVISDIHLGSDICNAKMLLETLQSYEYRKLIIVGDLFQDGGVLNDEHFEVIKYLRAYREKIKCIDGNHDPVEESLVNGVIGIHVVKKYHWEMNGKKLCAMHGHQFDKWCFIFSEPFIDRFFLNFMWLLKMVTIKGWSLASWFESFHNEFSRRLADRAIKYARKKNIDMIICGHTHQPVHVKFRGKKSEVDYFNCGAWVENMCSFITIDKDCNIQLHLVSCSAS